jgi:hypothetical protein
MVMQLLKTLHLPPNTKTSRSSSESDSLSSFNDSDESDDIDFNKQNLSDPNSYPLLAHLGIPISDKFTYDALVQEMLKFNSEKSMSYMQGNQTRATLSKIPPIKKEENLRETLSRKESIIDDMISFMGSAMKVEDVDAAKKHSSKVYARSAFIKVS